MKTIWTGKLAGKVTKVEQDNSDVLITMRLRPLVAQKMFERPKVIANGMIDWVVSMDDKDFPVFADVFELTDEERGKDGI